MAHEWDLGSAGVDDMLAMAVAIEQGGRDFYDRLRAEAADPYVRKELEFLSGEESAHERYFLSQMKAGAGRPGRLAAGLQTILERELLQPLQALYASAGVKDNRTALRFGVVLEEKSISFYINMRSAASQAQQDALDRIISEEEGHKAKLQLLLSHY